MIKCPAKNVTCNHCRKIGHHERTCRSKNTLSRGRGRVYTIQEQDGEILEYTDSSGDYVVMAIRSKEATELKVAGLQLSVKITKRATRLWIDSGSSISIFTVDKLRSTLGAPNIRLENLTPEDKEYRDYGKNPLKLHRAMAVQPESNGWNTTARIRVIGGNRPSIIGRDFMDKLGLKLIQQQPEGTVMAIDQDRADDLEPIDSVAGIFQ